MGEETDADAWWSRLSPERRIQVHRWVAGQNKTGHKAVEGQLEIQEGEA